MNDNEIYRGATIHIRKIRTKHTAEFSWLTEKSKRIHGGSATHRQVAVMKCRQTIDAEIAARDVCNTFFKRALV